MNKEKNGEEEEEDYNDDDDGDEEGDTWNRNSIVVDGGM